MLRLATIEDAETIALIHVRSWQTAYEGIVPAQFLAALSIQERANMWRKVISEYHGIVLLAASPHGEVGFISFGPSCDEDGRKKAEIYAIYVLSQFWHQGIGRELLDEAEWLSRCAKIGDYGKKGFFCSFRVKFMRLTKQRWPRPRAHSAALRLLKVESGINGLLPTSWVPPFIPFLS